MVTVYIVPNWFHGYDVSFEIMFAVITLLVSLFSFKIFKLSEQKESKYFAVGFLLISLSYFVWAFLNLRLVSELKEGVRVLELKNLLIFSTVSIYVYMILALVGIIVIAYTTLKINNEIAFLLIVIPSIATLFLSNNKTLAFGILSSIMLLFIFVHFYLEFRKDNNLKRGLVMVAFLLLFIGNIEFSFVQNSYVHYVVRHILDLAAYVLVLISLIWVIKNGQKKKQT